MPNKAKNTIVLILIIVIAFGAGIGVMISRSGEGKVLPPVDHYAYFASKEIADFPTALQVQGSYIQNATGQAVLLRGVTPPDPARLQERKEFNVQFLVGIQEAGANVVHIPVQPQNYVNDPDYMWRYLFPLVEWAGKMDMYAIVSWDATGDPATGAGLDVKNLEGLPKDLTAQFWRQNAAYFQTAPNVIFEIFAEPEGMTPEAWGNSAGELVRMIRAEGYKNLILVSGTDSARDLSWVLDNPIQDENLAYSVHLSPGESQAEWAQKFGDGSELVPVVITEWGFMDENRRPETENLAGTQAEFGDPLLDYLNEKQIGWIAAGYGDESAPPMFKDGFQNPTRYGQFVLDRLSLTSTP